jgi:hypothetical protein
MSQNEPAPLENAEAIIEMFGGIRPMATKISVPVTTVQGWKKRNVIPGTRREEILRVAKQLGLDISKIMQAEQRPVQGSGVNIPDKIDSTDFTSRNTQKTPDEAPSFIKPEPYVPLKAENTLESELVRSERRAVTKSTAINLFLVLIATVSVVLLLLPERDRRIEALENDISAIKEKQSFIRSLIPDDIEAKFAALQAQLTGYRPALDTALKEAQAVSNDVLGPNAGNLEQRAHKLEGHVTDITGITPPANFAALAARLQSLSESTHGQQQLNQSMAQLMTLLSGVPEEDPVQVEQALQTAPQQDPALAETFAGVPPQDLKAAALLLGMTQFRSSLNRDNQPFEQDLALMKKLVGTDDPELAAAIDRLAPYAQQGVLTPSGLSQEFRGLAGDVVVASLQGDDVSIQEKAQARLGDMFQVEKNGEQVSGTPTQKTIAKTDKLLQEGNLEGAVAQMQTLNGPALVAAQPWLTKAQATLMAQKFKRMLTSTINVKALGGGSPIYNTGGPLPGARGLNLPPAPGLIEEDSSIAAPAGE